MENLFMGFSSSFASESPLAEDCSGGITSRVALHWLELYMPRCWPNSLLLLSTSVSPSRVAFAKGCPRC